MGELLGISGKTVQAIELGKLRLTEENRAKVDVMAGRYEGVCRAERIERMVADYREELERTL
jgi:hypothetical protein